MLSQNKKISNTEEISFIFPENYIKSIAFYDKPESSQRSKSSRQSKATHQFKATQVQYFLNGHRDLVPDTTSHLARLCDEHSGGMAIQQMEGIYSHIFIDELQDYAAWDLEIIFLLFMSQISITCVGDYKQSTYRTNKFPKYIQYRDEKIRDFFHEPKSRGLCKVVYENTTRRFNQEICDYINTIHDDVEAMVEPSPDI